MRAMGPPVRVLCSRRPNSVAGPKPLWYIRTLHNYPNVLSLLFIDSSCMVGLRYIHHTPRQRSFSLPTYV